MNSRAHSKKAMAAVIVAVAFVCAAVSEVRAQGDPSVELREARLAVEALQAKVAELEKSVLASERKVSALGEGLAAANAESGQFRESYRKIRLQLEALGVSVLDGDDSLLEQRLLQAVNDRRLLLDDNARLADEVANLSEVLLNFMKSSVGAEPAAQELATNALEQAEVTLRESVPKETGSELPEAESRGEIRNARVISVKADYGLIVFNVGREHGVRVGMPFRVVRKERPIGSVLVVEVREKVCGAVVQRLESEEPFAVGDIGRVVAE